MCFVNSFLSKSSASASPENITSAASATVQQQAACSSRKVKLPKFSLPSFAGDATQWISFWDSFASAIHDNNDLNDIDKFQYLRSCLQGSAAETVAGLQLTSANYKEAVKLLQARFANKQIIISKHIDTLMELNQISKSEDIGALRLWYDPAEAIVRSLQGIGVQADTYGTFLTPIIVGKLPSDLRLILSRHLGEQWNLDSLLKEFGVELQLREKCVLGAGQEEQRATFRKSSRNQHFTASSLIAEVEKESQHSAGACVSVNTGVKANSWCTFCSGGHSSGKCAVATDPVARKKILRQKGKCFLCLKASHVSRNIQCYRCGSEKHCLAIRTMPKSAPKEGKTGNAEKEPTVSTTGNVNLYFTQGSKNNCVLLQTAKAKVSTPNNVSNSCTVRLLFDSWSQKSYISTRLRNQLCLPTINTDNVLIKPFGKEDATLKRCDVVQFVVECRDNLNVFINAYEVDVICGPIANQTIDFAQQHYPHLQNLPLADSASGDKGLEVDVMIGADYYWSFVQNHVVRGESSYSPVAIRTRLGYVTSGPVNVPTGSEISSCLSISLTMKTECSVLEDFSSWDGTLRTELGRFWDYDTLGIRTDEQDECEVCVEKIKFN